RPGHPRYRLHRAGAASTHRRARGGRADGRLPRLRRRQLLRWTDARAERRGRDALTTLDLVIRGGHVVTSGARGLADIGIAGGRVVQLGGEMRGGSEIDATGKLVLPGGVDVHVHLSQPRRPEPESELWVDDFDSGSR